MWSAKKSKRILFITADAGAGGSTKAIIPVLTDLHKRGYSVFVIIPSEGYFSQTLRSLGIKYAINKYIRVNVWTSCKDLKSTLYYIPKMIKLIIYGIMGCRKLFSQVHEFKPNIIYSNSSLLLYGYLVAKKLKIPHIWHIHEYGDKDFGINYFPSNKIKLKLLQSTPSISITKEIFDSYKLNKGLVIYNGVRELSSLNMVENKVSQIDARYFLFVGLITPRKGITDLFNAYIKYCEMGGSLKLVLCGTVQPMYKQYLIRLANQFNDIEKRIIFVGQVNNVNDYMLQAEALIVPSQYEAFGLVTSEAMFNRCLIIGRNTGGTKEQLDLGAEQNSHEIGLRFNTVDELAQLLSHAENMTIEERNSFIEPAYKTAVNNFTIEQFTTRVRNFIDSVLDSTNNVTNYQKPHTS